MRHPTETSDDDDAVDDLDRDGPHEEASEDDGDLIQLLDRLEQRIVGATRVPLTPKILVDPFEFDDVLAKIRFVSQGGARQARSVVRMRDRLLADAREQATRLVRGAEERAAELQSEEGLREAAHRESNRLVDDAILRAEKAQADADQYAADILLALRDQLLHVQRAISGEP